MDEAPDGDKFMCYLGAAICVTTAAIAAGVTVGLVPLEPFDMKLLLETNEEDCETLEEREVLKREKECAVSLLPLISEHHRLLVSLLLLNSIANEALPVFLDEIYPPYVAVLVSACLVLVIGEIIPFALFTGPNQLYYSAKFAPFVRFILFIFYPFAGPVAWLLDRWLETDETFKYNKAEFRALVKVNMAGGCPGNNSNAEFLLGRKTTSTKGLKSRKSRRILGEPRSQNKRSSDAIPSIFLTTADNPHTPAHPPALPGTLSQDEHDIITGALEVSRMGASDAMRPMDRVFMLSMEDELNLDTMAEMLARGHSRIPVYDGNPHNIRGILMVKRLIALCPSDSRKISTLGLRVPLVIGLHDKLLDVLNRFQTGTSHIGIVTNKPEVLINAMRKGHQVPVNVHLAGIITLEDILENIIRQQIHDEEDASVKATLIWSERKDRRRQMLREMAEVAKKQRLERQEVNEGSDAPVEINPENETPESQAEEPNNPGAIPMSSPPPSSPSDWQESP